MFRSMAITAALLQLTTATKSQGVQSFSCSNSFISGKQCHNKPGNTPWISSATSQSACVSACNAATSSASTICCYYTPGGGTEGCKVYTEISSSNSAYQWTGSLVSNNYGNGRSAQICSRAAYSTFGSISMFIHE